MSTDPTSRPVDAPLNRTRPNLEIAMANKPQRKEEEKFVVRLPAGMRDRIAIKARVNSRSMNAEIVHRLERATELEVELERAHQVIDRLLSGSKATTAEALESRT